jgi:transposase
MTVRTVNNLPAATHGETVRCLFAIELSKQSWVIGFNTPLSEKISRRTLSGCDWKGLLELIEGVRARVSREMGRAVAVMSCYEAGYDGFWLHRERDRLVLERVQHVNRIKGLCALHGIYDYHPLRPQATARLEQLRTAQGGELPPRLKSEIKRELHRLELVVEMIATLEAERDAIVEDEASTHLNAEKIQNLHKLKAIGPEFAAVLVGEIFHRSFDNRRQLASYVGVTPSPFQSGSMAHEGGISKAGNRKGRTTGIELAWLWLRYQPDSDLSIWFRARVGIMKGRIRRIAIVALTRKLLVALWRYLETGLVPRGAVLKG